MNNALDDLLFRVGAIVPRIELERAAGKDMTEQLLASRQIVTIGSSGSFVSATPSLRDPRR